MEQKRKPQYNPERLNAFQKELASRDMELSMLELRLRRLENITIETEVMKTIERTMDRTFRMSAVFFLSILKLDYPELYKKCAKSVTPYFAINNGDQLIISARRAYYYLSKEGKLEDILKDLRFPVILDECTLWDMFSKKKVVTNVFKLIRYAKSPQNVFSNVVDFELKKSDLINRETNNNICTNYDSNSTNSTNINEKPNEKSIEVDKIKEFKLNDLYDED